MSQVGKLTPNLDQQSTKILNLTVLQRMDPCIEEILMTAAHVTFYEFSIELNQWKTLKQNVGSEACLYVGSTRRWLIRLRSRKDVEGSLFVVKRNTQPRFQFVVMNRRNTDNLVENLLDFEYEIHVPYLLYRNAAQEVNGIWFYNSRECEDVANLFSRILSAYSKVPSKPKVFSTKSEFEELERVPTTTVIEGPLEPSPTASTVADVPEDSSFVNFFSSALNIGANSSNLTRSQPYHSPVPVPLSSSESSIVSSLAACPHVPSLPLSASSSTTLPPLPFHDTHDPIGNSNRVTNLVKPSSFFVPSSSSSILMTPQGVPMSSNMPTTAPQPPLNLQHQYGAPMLHPFPLPNPPASLTHSSTFAPNFGPVISRDKVHDALQMLAQDNQFIEMFYQALLRVHNP